MGRRIALGIVGDHDPTFQRPRGGGGQTMTFLSRSVPISSGV
jgi:hypothetical protein